MMEQLLFGLRLAALLGFSGLFFTLGIACACRLLGWAPINVTVNNHTTLSSPSPGTADE